MTLIYGKSNKSFSAATSLYRKRPNRRAPVDTILKTGFQRETTATDNKIRVLETIDKNPHILEN